MHGNKYSYTTTKQTAIYVNLWVYSKGLMISISNRFDQFVQQYC